MGRKKELIAEVFDSVSDGLKNLYASKIKPIEMTYKFGEFYSPYLLDADFEAKPMVLLVGSYSTSARALTVKRSVDGDAKRARALTGFECD